MGADLRLFQSLHGSGTILIPMGFDFCRSCWGRSLPVMGKVFVLKNNMFVLTACFIPNQGEGMLL